MTAPYFVTGGTLRRDTPSYVSRDADAQLVQTLTERDICYVLTSRQMGKSSLMVRAAGELRAVGHRVAVVDLTALGVNLNVQQWYGGLVDRLGIQLDCEDELESAWDRNPDASPLQRWEAGITWLVENTESPITIFIDEIDIVRSLPFATDEFFAAIRMFYNRRSDDQRWNKISFCLLGVASPSDLIGDARMTPFNIGQRIELHDFDESELIPLRDGLSNDKTANQQIVSRVFHWTSGHPYLTQKLCSEVAAALESGVHETSDAAALVDQVSEQTFLSSAGREFDDNLVFVRERILRSSDDVAATLHTYSRIADGTLDPKTAGSRELEALTLSGIAVQEGQSYRVRNRIYRHVFDADWVANSMPDAELRRQRAAFVSGLVRASAIAAVIVLSLAAAFVFSFYQWRIADSARQASEQDGRNLSKLLARAEEARQQAEDAKEAAQQSRQEALAARDEEEAAKKSLQISFLAEQQALALAKREEEAAKEAQKQAEELREKAEASQADAVRQQALAQQSADAARDALEKTKIAYREMQAAKNSSETVSGLLSQIPDWLQAYSAEAVAKHAATLAADGKQSEALNTYAQFAEMALRQREGFWAHQLVDFHPKQLTGVQLEEDWLQKRISVSDEDMLNLVVRPALALGQQFVTASSPTIDRSALAAIHASHGLLIFSEEHASPFKEQNADKVVASFTEAIDLNPVPYEYYLARATARFHSSKVDLSAIQQDIQDSIKHYPSQAADDRSKSDLAMLHHSLANVFEMTTRTGSTDAIGYATQAVVSNQEAISLNETLDTYHAAYIRTLLLSAELTETPAQKQSSISKAVAHLQVVADRFSESAEIKNAAGLIEFEQQRYTAAAERFASAFQFAAKSGADLSRFRFLCNEAGSRSRVASDMSSWRQVFNVAQKATVLDVTDKSEAYFYEGIAAWNQSKLAVTPDTSRERLVLAVQSLKSGAESNPGHIGCLLSLCQIFFENDLPAERTKLEIDPHALVDQAVSSAKSTADKAKAHYVRGLGHLSKAIKTRSDAPFIACLEDMLAATKLSPAYRPLAATYFARMQRWAFKSTDAKVRAAKVAESFLDAG